MLLQTMTHDGFTPLLNGLGEAYGVWSAYAYFVFLLVVGGSFIMNFSVAILSVKYREGMRQLHAEPKEDSKREEPKRRRGLLDMSHHSKIVNSCTFRTRLFLIRAVNHWVFELVVTSAIIVDCVLIGMYYAPTCCVDSHGFCTHNTPSCIRQAGYMDPNFELVAEKINFVCLGVYTTEMAFKLASSGVIQYFRQRSNQFDSSIVLVSYLELLLQFYMGGSKAAFRFIRLQRIFRVARVLRLVKFVKNVSRDSVSLRLRCTHCTFWVQLQSMRTLIDSVLQTAPSWGVLSVLLFVMWFIVSLMGR